MISSLDNKPTFKFFFKAIALITSGSMPFPSSCILILKVFRSLVKGDL
jgi:hypothetical protein